jgi:hypothetical protein
VSGVHKAGRPWWRQKQSAAKGKRKPATDRVTQPCGGWRRDEMREERDLKKKKQGSLGNETAGQR